MKDYAAVAIVVATFILAVAVSMGISMALVYGVCWAFGWTYTHKIAIGVWFIICLVRMAMKGGKEG